MRKNKYGMPPPENRIEFEHNISILIEKSIHKMKNNQLDPHFVQETLPRLRSLVLTPNGRIDFNSVDEQLRLLSNMEHWEELINIHENI